MGLSEKLPGRGSISPEAWVKKNVSLVGPGREHSSQGTAAVEAPSGSVLAGQGRVGCLCGSPQRLWLRVSLHHVVRAVEGGEGLSRVMPAGIATFQGSLWVGADQAVAEAGAGSS